MKVIVRPGRAQAMEPQGQCFYGQLGGGMHAAQHQFKVYRIGPLGLLKCVNCGLWQLWLSYWEMVDKVNAGMKR